MFCCFNTPGSQPSLPAFLISLYRLGMYLCIYIYIHIYIYCIYIINIYIYIYYKCTSPSHPGGTPARGHKNLGEGDPQTLQCAAAPGRTSGGPGRPPGRSSCYYIIEMTMIMMMIKTIILMIVIYNSNI